MVIMEFFGESYFDISCSPGTGCTKPMKLINPIANYEIVLYTIFGEKNHFLNHQMIVYEKIYDIC